VKLKATCKLSRLLTHLYVLIPVMDDDKHYWVGDDEVEKLLKHGKDWLASHPERDLIAKKYLSHKKSLTREALERLSDGDKTDPGLSCSLHPTSNTTASSKHSRLDTCGTATTDLNGLAKSFTRGASASRSSMVIQSAIYR
jgi:hypothetical protein